MLSYIVYFSITYRQCSEIVYDSLSYILKRFLISSVTIRSITTVCGVEVDVGSWSWFLVFARRSPEQTRAGCAFILHTHIELRAASRKGFFFELINFFLVYFYFWKSVETKNVCSRATADVTATGPDGGGFFDGGTRHYHQGEGDWSGGGRVAGRFGRVPPN